MATAAALEWCELLPVHARCLASTNTLPPRLQGRTEALGALLSAACLALPAVGQRLDEV